MFEREFYDNNLDKIESEKEFLDKTLNELTNDSSIKMITRLLDEEKVIINRHKFSINLNEKSKLYRQFLEKEKQIYEIYCSNSKIKNEKKRYIEHMSNAVELDIRKIYNYFSNHTSAFISILTLFGIFLYIPYFLSISEIPQTNANIMAIVVSMAIVLITFLCLIFSNYFLFIISRDIQKISIPIIFFYHLIWFFIVFAPIAQMKYSNYIYEHIEILSLIWLGLLLFIGLCKIIKDKEKDISIAYALLFMAMFMLIDWFVILIVYLRLDEINGFFTFSILLILFFSRLISIATTFDYRLHSVFAILVLIMFICFASKDFARLAKLGNYNDNFIVNTKFVPQDILDANLTNCGARNTTCIEKFDENLTKFTNLKVIVVLDKKYKVALNPKFECKFKDDNKSAVCGVDDSELLLDKTNLSCESHLRDDNKTCDYEFEIYEKNIAG